MWYMMGTGFDFLIIFPVEYPPTPNATIYLQRSTYKLVPPLATAGAGRATDPPQKGGVTDECNISHIL
jgi:hypothetical protein